MLIGPAPDLRPCLIFGGIIDRHKELSNRSSATIIYQDNGPVDTTLLRELICFCSATIETDDEHPGCRATGFRRAAAGFLRLGGISASQVLGIGALQPHRDRRTVADMPIVSHCVV